MNPPFSLEDWGYDDLLGGDPHHRFEFGLPPRDNGDYAWLQQAAKSLSGSLSEMLRCAHLKIARQPGSHLFLQDDPKVRGSGAVCNDG